MNVGQLKERLEEYEDSVEVRLMSQPSWPFEWDILGTWQPEVSELCEDCGSVKTDPIHMEPDTDESDFHEFLNEGFEPNGGLKPDEVLYLVEGSQLAYGDKQAFEDVEKIW